MNVPAPAASVNVPVTCDVIEPRGLAFAVGAAGAADAGDANTANVPVRRRARTAAVS
ncbi:hypothetical protein GCM10009557_49200 [Virgisporangium ochraceum]|uniref:Uncharacterized protein n=1 Tax=Virgisporangium ochraceum TaxID=65505 RepID=A0A8J4E9R3_9ACTN|nr:hypothetical protein Voc01_016310 [Virgisporangium ochraceum]